MEWLMDWAGLTHAHVLILAIGLPALGWALCWLTSWRKARIAAERAFWDAMREEYGNFMNWADDELSELQAAVRSALSAHEDEEDE